MTVEDAKRDIQEIRSEKFGLLPDGTKRQNALARDLRAALKHIGEELNAKETHFILELLQNAEDNTYPPGVEPTLSLCVEAIDPTSSGGDGCLRLLNNEIDFTPSQVSSLCSVGQSTKDKARGYIGEKGIGFKSVFRVTDQPHIYSNGYRFRFQKPQGVDDLGYIVPHWVESEPGEIPSGFTAIYLPLIAGKRAGISKKLSEILPESILFLSKLRRLQICSEHFIARDRATGLVKLSTPSDESLYFVQRQTWSKPDGFTEEKRPGISERELTLALPLRTPLPCTGRVFAFLPTEMDTGLPFLVNADFLLTSSRDNLLEDRKWNEWLRDMIAPTFVNAFFALLSEHAERYEAYGCIPIRSDVSMGAEYFAPVVDAILNELQTRPCILSTDGEFCLPSQVYFAGPLTRRLLADAPRGKHNLRLIDPVLEGTRYRRRLGQSGGLGVGSINFGQIFAACADCAWLSSRSLDWWEVLFDLLVQCEVSASTIGSFPLLLCEDGVCRSLSAGVFLHPEAHPQAAAISPDWPTVHFLHAELQGRLRKKPQQVHDWLARTTGIRSFSVEAYITGHLLEWMRRQAAEHATARLIEATRFIALNLKRPEEHKETLRAKMPWLLAEQRALLPETRGDKKLVLPECLEGETGWNWVFIGPQDRQHFWLLSDAYFDDQPDTTREAVRRLMGHCGATDLPDPAKTVNAAGCCGWHAPRWLRDLHRNHLPQSLETKVAALEHWIGRFEQHRTGSFVRFLTCANEWSVRDAFGAQPSELGLALRGRPWLRSTIGWVAPTTAFVDEPEIKGFLGESVAYTSSKLPRELLERLGVRVRLTVASLFGELRRMKDSGPVDEALVVRIYQRLQTETFDPVIFHNEQLIYLNDPTPRWLSVEETVWEDLGEPFDPYFGFVARTYRKEDLYRFFTQRLGVSKDPSLRKLVEIWADMSSTIPDAPDFCEGRLREIIRRCATELDELQKADWWPSIRSRLAVWTTDRHFAQPETAYAPDDGFAEQIFAGKVRIAWALKGQSPVRLGELFREVGCPSLAGEIRSRFDSAGETELMESQVILTQASKELLFLWVCCEKKGWEKRKDRLQSLIRSAEALVENLSVEYSLHRSSISSSKNMAAFWSVDESRLLFDSTSIPEARRSAAAKSIAASFGHVTKDDEDTAYRLLTQSPEGATALAFERKWLLPAEASLWLQELGVHRVMATNVGEASIPASRTIRPTLTTQNAIGSDQPTSGEPSTATVSAEADIQTISLPVSKSSDAQIGMKSASNADAVPQTTRAAMSSPTQRAANTSPARLNASSEELSRAPKPLKSPDDEDAEVHVAAHTRSRPNTRQQARTVNAQASGKVEDSNSLASISQHRKSEVEDMAVRHIMRQLRLLPEFRGFDAIDVRKKNYGYDLLVHGPSSTGLRIEIKAHQSDPLVVFITKNEWDESRRESSRDGYRWELWNVCNLASTDRVRIVRYSHIPHEAVIRESGYWVDLSKCAITRSD